jgi:hypothetical protein
MTDIVQAYQSVSGFSDYPQEFLIIILRPIKASGISNIRVGVVYKAKHEICTQVVAVSLPGSGCS